MPEEGRPFLVALSLDVDPDANVPRAGSPTAVSAGHDTGGVSLESCRRGLQTVSDIIEQLSIPCTLFWEGRALEHFCDSASGLVTRFSDESRFEHGCHGLKHEDFAGTVSGRPLGGAETLAVVEAASEICRSAFGVRPSGFRAPYCRLTDELVEALSDLDYKYDASVMRRPGPNWDLRPYALASGPDRSALWEIPICRTSDGKGKPISGYLWQLFEGKRSAQEYLDAIAALKRDHRGGLFQIALHPWHLYTSQDGQKFSEARSREAADELLRLISEAGKMNGLQFTTLGGYLDLFLSSSER